MAIRVDVRLEWAIAALVVILGVVVGTSAAYAQTVVDPRIAEFDPSPDHDATLSDGQSAVLRYDLEFFQMGAGQPFQVTDLGKPSPDTDGKVRVDFTTLLVPWPVPGIEYEARVMAVGPTGSGQSEPSNPFLFTAPCSYSISPMSESFGAGGGTGSVTVTAGERLFLDRHECGELGHDDGWRWERDRERWLHGGDECVDHVPHGDVDNCRRHLHGDTGGGQLCLLDLPDERIVRRRWGDRQCDGHGGERLFLDRHESAELGHDDRWGRERDRECRLHGGDECLDHLPHGDVDDCRRHLHGDTGGGELYLLDFADERIL